MFRKEGDYLAFERIIAEAQERHPLRILSWCVMPSHWHFVVWPQRDGEVTDFFRWLAHTHAMRWRVSHGTVGYGHLYQGRFKIFPVQRDEHLRTVCRYVERNALTAGLVTRAEQWRWGSLWVRENGTEEQRKVLSSWPAARREDWVQYVNAPLTTKEAQGMRLSMKRSRPYGGDDWIQRTAAELGLEHTMRPEGRPRKEPEEEN